MKCRAVTEYRNTLLLIAFSAAIPSITGAQPGGARNAVADTLRLPGLLQLAAMPAVDQVDDPPTWKVTLASFALPGSGQIMTGRKWGWGLVAAEVTLIGSAVWAGMEGRDLKQGYERYADTHWDRQRFLDYLDAYESLTGEEWPYDHHTLPPEGVRGHDFYEMIGKYEQFAPGWEDWLASTDTPYRGYSATRDSYLDRRVDANRYLKWSLTAGGLIFLNHVASGTEMLLWNRWKGERERSLAQRMTPWKAASRSLLFPGWGQRLQGRRGLATTLMLAEGVFWGGLVGWRSYSGWKMDDSRRWAVSFAGVSTTGKDAAYWRAIELYPDWTTYNAAQLSGLGSPSEVYPAGIGYEWRWESEPAWKKYRELRRDSRRTKNYATLAVGGIVVGRLVGAAAALITGRLEDPDVAGYRGTGHRGSGRGIDVRFSPWLDPGPVRGAGIGMRVSW